MSKPITNHSLDALLVESGYHKAHASLARQVNAAGRDRYGLTLKYDGASIYWWLRGRCPEQPTPELIAAVLSRKLERTVTAAELGLDTSGPGVARVGLDFPATIEQSITGVTGLWKCLVLRRELLANGPFVAAAAIEAGWRWHFESPDHRVARYGDRTVTMADIAVLRACQQQFLDLDRRFGGGHARRFLVDFLDREAAPLLHGTYTDEVGRALFTAVAQLTGQMAYMAFDVGDQPVAQRCFIQALRLAKMADNHALGAHILANMSTQAVALNRPSDAVTLANAALDGARRRAPSTVMARLHTAAASAHAIAGDKRNCSASLRDAERAMSRPQSGPTWAGYFTQAHLAGTAVRCFRDLGQPSTALRYAESALHLGDASVRTAALHAALTATVKIDAGDIDGACQLAIQASALSKQVISVRVDDRMSDLMLRLAPFKATHADVADLVAKHSGRSHGGANRSKEARTLQ